MVSDLVGNAVFVVAYCIGAKLRLYPANNNFIGKVSVGNVVGLGWVNIKKSGV